MGDNDYTEPMDETPRDDSGADKIDMVRPQPGGTLLRGRSSEALNRPTPKGINLHFNYKATTNQTQLYLNERFTTLRLRGQGSRITRESGRGRGQARGRGQDRGRGQIRGRGQARGRGFSRGRGEISGGRVGARGVIKEGPAMIRGGGGGRAREIK
ncbi:spidroin-1 [Silurus asotus]|uniref:Spidroin-1 n=1 Tax=Silurus asotus TaxID=30991 RepID=A0AAD5F9E4_SILAS|nr:spidroin-1 [Silurus asotus]